MGSHGFNICLPNYWKLHEVKGNMYSPTMGTCPPWVNTGKNESLPHDLKPQNKKEGGSGYHTCLSSWKNERLRGSVISAVWYAKVPPSQPPPGMQRWLCKSLKGFWLSRKHELTSSTYKQGTYPSNTHQLPCKKAVKGISSGTNSLGGQFRKQYQEWHVLVWNENPHSCHPKSMHAMSKNRGGLII